MVLRHTVCDVGNAAVDFVVALAISVRSLFLWLWTQIFRVNAFVKEEEDYVYMKRLVLGRKEY
jgi:hypothetical protein